MTAQGLLENLEDAGCGPESVFGRWNPPVNIRSS